MKQSFDHVLELSLKHSYFKKGIFKPTNISFGEQTSGILRNLGLILKPFTGGIHLLAADKELLESGPGSQPLRLYLSCDHPYFINYTALPDDYKLSDTILYFNNLGKGFNAPGGGSYLHQNEFVDNKDVASLSFGKFSIPRDNAQQPVTFLDVQDQPVSKNHIRPSSIKPNEFTVSGLEEGIIRIMRGKKELKQVYYVPSRVWKNPLGIIELYTGKLHEDLNTIPKQLALNFNNRQTKWKYFLVDPVYQKFNNLSIINGKKEVIFEGPEGHQKEPGEPWIFLSKDEIPLLEYSEENFKLFDEDKSTTILSVLPRASPEQLFYDDENNKESIYSHIYI